MPRITFWHKNHLITHTLSNLNKHLHKPSPFSPLALLISLLILLISPYSSLVSAGPYLDSAHGNTSYGVNRSSIASLGYAQGNCAHCHEQHASIGGDSHTPYDYELFATYSTDFCYQCHKGTGSVQVGGITNNNYSGPDFGGGTADFTNIYDAFNADASGGSSHDLASVLQYAKDLGYVPSSHNNACLVCHPVHRAKANKRDPDDPTDTCIRRPSDYGTDNLWGDDTNEQMNDNWSATYQAPYFSSTSSYEPGGTSSTDGSKHPDYATFCLDCHSTWDGEGTDCGPGIDWPDTRGCNRPPAHGNADGDWDPADEGDCASPWSAEGRYVLSCLDCHEPHGSTNWHLLRTEVNNSSVTWTSRPTKNSPGDFCFACHKNVDSGHYAWYTYCDECHTHEGSRPI